MNRSRLSGLGVLLCLLATQAMAQGGVYTCTDARGRRITADRPIPDCADREQRVLKSDGTVKERIGPSLTAEERARKEAQDRLEQEERQRQVELLRRERALLIRYPNQAAHDRDRADALSQIDVGTRSAQGRLDELKKQRARLSEEMEFYVKDPSKAPAYLRTQLEENAKNIKAQENFIAEQDLERRRVDLRFDEELAKLRRVWKTTVSTH